MDVRVAEAVGQSPAFSERKALAHWDNGNFDPEANSLEDLCAG